jgi:hypothetical protein
VAGFGQINVEQTKLYYDSDWNLTSPNLPSYQWTSGINKLNLSFQGLVTVTTPQDGQVIVRGQFRKGRKTGYWKLNYGNGVTFAEGEFRNDRKKGKWAYRYPDGRLMLTVEFKGRDFRILSSIDSSGNNRLLKGTGTWEWNHFLGKKPVVYSGSYENKKRTGTWSIVDLTNGDTLLIEVYKQDSFVSGQSIFRDTTILLSKPYFTSDIFNDRYLAKMENVSFGQYAGRVFYPLLQFLPTNPSFSPRVRFSTIEEIYSYIAYSFFWGVLNPAGFSSGEVEVSFVVDEQGRFEAFRIVSGSSGEINEIITRSFYQMPLWDTSSNEIPIGSPYFLSVTIE